MKRDEILSTKAGRELDVSIGYYVMDLHCHPDLYPNYSTNISDAWKVVEKLQYMGYMVHLSCMKEFFITLEHDNHNKEMDYWIGAETAPLAICRAAALTLHGFDE